jgi:hypothetical protein
LSLGNPGEIRKIFDLNSEGVLAWLPEAFFKERVTMGWVTWQVANSFRVSC